MGAEIKSCVPSTHKCLTLSRTHIPTHTHTHTHTHFPLAANLVNNKLDRLELRQPVKDGNSHTGQEGPGWEPKGMT